MRTSALRRAVTAWIVLSICALLLGSGIVGNTFATFNAETTNASSTFSDGWLGAASNGSATAGGYDMTVNWTPTTTGPIGGQKILGIDNTTSSNCTSAAYAAIATLASATTATYSDASRATSGTDGDWFCYELMSTSTSAPNWTTPYSFPAVQIGLVANAVTITNSGTAGTIGNGDTIKITFNQQTTLAGSGSGGLEVCSWSTTNTIVLGDTHGGTCHASNDNYSLGTLKLTGGDTIASAAFGSSTSVVSATSPWTVTVTLGGGGSSLISGSSTPTWTFTPYASIVSHQTTHQATICTAGTNCQPATSTTNF